MSKGGKPKDVFDVERIEQIIQLMERHDLSEVDLQQGDEKIKLSRGGAAPVYAGPAVAAPPVAPQPVAPQPDPSSAAPPAAASSDSAAGTVVITAPMVGTFYTRSSPESEPFVKIGDRVHEETIVCIVEAMKVFNEIPAECKGKIVEILVDDHEPVDFGKPLFRVQPG